MLQRAIEAESWSFLHGLSFLVSELVGEEEDEAESEDDDDEEAADGVEEAADPYPIETEGFEWQIIVSEAQ